MYFPCFLYPNSLIFILLLEYPSVKITLGDTSFESTKMKLQFTNNYRPRFDQISRIMQFLLTQGGSKKVARKDIIAALGIPINQIESLTSMMIGFGLITIRTSLLTLFGKTVIQNDPYFDKIETLWMIHYIVSSEPEWVVWHRIINKVLPFQDTFESEKVSVSYFSDLSAFFSQSTISEKIPTEVGAVFAAYTRSNLSRLESLMLKRQENSLKQFQSKSLILHSCSVWSSSAINIHLVPPQLIFKISVFPKTVRAGF